MKAARSNLTLALQALLLSASLLGTGCARQETSTDSSRSTSSTDASQPATSAESAQTSQSTGACDPATFQKRLTDHMNDIHHEQGQVDVAYESFAIGQPHNSMGNDGRTFVARDVATRFVVTTVGEDILDHSIIHTKHFRYDATITFIEDEFGRCNLDTGGLGIGTNGKQDP